MPPVSLLVQRAVAVGIILCLLQGFADQGPTVTAGAQRQTFPDNATVALSASGETQSQDLTVAVDTKPHGNGAMSLGALDACTETASDQVRVDIILDRLPAGADLAGLQFVVRFNGDVLRMDEQDWDFILASSGGSILPASRHLGSDPNNPDAQVWALAALRIGGEEITDVAGVAVRLTFSTLAAGTSGIEVLPASPTAPAIQSKVVNVDNSLVPIDGFLPASVAVSPLTCSDAITPASPSLLSQEELAQAAAAGSLTELVTDETDADSETTGSSRSDSASLSTDGDSLGGSAGGDGDGAQASTDHGPGAEPGSLLQDGDGKSQGGSDHAAVIAGSLAGGLLVLAAGGWLLRNRVRPWLGR